MGTTTGGLPYPEPTDSPDGPAQMQAFAEAVQDALDDLFSAWTSYTPALTATTTNPTLGTGSVAIGLYLALGKLLIVKGSIRFGTSGANAGVGTYEIGLPFAVNNSLGSSFAPSAQVLLRDDSANNVVTEGVGSINGDGDAKFRMRYPAASPSGTPNLVSGTQPWAWSNNDRLDFLGTFELA